METIHHTQGPAHTEAPKERARAPEDPARSKLGKDYDNCHRLCDKGSLNHFSPGNSHLAWGTSPPHSQVLDLKEVRKQYHYCVISIINYGYNYDTHR